MRKFKTKPEEYGFYVNLGKMLLKDIECYQVKIAFYASKVCQIRHGGISRGLYTLTDYARDIGISNKTLSEWVIIYKNVVSKLDINEADFSKKDWLAASRVSELLRNEKRVSQKLNGLEGKRERGIPSDLGKERIKDLFNRNYDSGSFQLSIDQFSNKVKETKNALVSKDLNTLSFSSLIELKESLDATSMVIFNHFNTKLRMSAIGNTQTLSQTLSA